MLQDFLRKYLGFIIDPIVTLIGKINWKQRHPLTDEQKNQIMDLLKKDYYIITTRHGNHLSTYMISLGNFLLTGKFSFWGHVLMNFENEVNSVDDFILVEAIGKGSQYGTFEEVFGDADSVCLMKPKHMTIDEWTKVLDKARTEIGKPYDTLFDLANDQKLSCVELVRDALMAEPNYSTDFANFENMIAKAKNLTPQMYYDCPDLEKVLEFRNH